MIWPFRRRMTEEEFLRRVMVACGGELKLEPPKPKRAPYPQAVIVRADRALADLLKSVK